MRVDAYMKNYFIFNILPVALIELLLAICNEQRAKAVIQYITFFRIQFYFKLSINISITILKIKPSVGK